MSITSRIFGSFFNLPRAETYNIVVERALKIPMPDGTILLADHYFPGGTTKLPTILVRCPYGRGSLYGLTSGRLLAERGFQVLLQSCRGTFGSGGEFEPFRNERDDGLATIEWMKKQEWFSGEFGTAGASYLGYVQWAIARDAGPALKAIAVQVTASEFRGMTYPGDTYSLSDCLTWTNLINTQEKSRFGSFSTMFRARKLKPGFNELPLKDADNLVVGQPVKFWQDWLEHSEPGDAWWKPMDHSDTVSQVTSPVNLIGGWYDIFLPWTVKDYLALKNAGQTPYMMIGPWSHLNMRMIGESTRESIAWLRAYLLNDRSQLRQTPIRVFVMGIKEWRDFPEWPPPGYQPQAWYLQRGNKLSLEQSGESEPDRYRYDPADPTPHLGGAIMSLEAGPKDNRILEARHDVLVYTSATLERDLEVIGPMKATLFANSSLANTDFFVRLCDVHPSSKSFNLCDGIKRLRAGQFVPDEHGTVKVDVEMWPTAYRFLKGHRIRLHVSSGAHPRFARNLGSGEPLGSGSSLHVADQTIYHDPIHPSCITLPSRWVT